MPSCVGLPQTEEAESARLSAPAAKDRTVGLQYPSTRGGSTPTLSMFRTALSKVAPSMFQTALSKLEPPNFAGPASIAARAALKSGSDHRADDGQTGKTVL
jgi:hypothetical protein